MLKSLKPAGWREEKMGKLPQIITEDNKDIT